VIPGLPADASRAVCEILFSDQRIRKATLYGSRAKGRYRPGSDVDICLDAPALDFSSLVNLENRIDDLNLPWKFDLTVRQSLTNLELIDHIDRVGCSLRP